jgi:release factor glutamine methyltransferase
MSAPERVWTVLDLLQWTSDHFASKGIATARLDAECLLAYALDSQRLRLYLDYDKPVLESERARFRDLVKRRAEDRVPVAQLTGTREFWSLPLRVTRDVLTPRPDTETLVEAALRRAGDAQGELALLEIGTGSGAVAIALAAELPRCRVTATDVCPRALRVASANAEALGVADRVRFIEGDLFAPVADERFDALVSNPPYMAHGEAASLEPELAHEPEGALFAGPDGSELLRRIAEQAPSVLRPGGWLALELAPPQAGAVARWLEDSGLEDVREHRDLTGRPRVVSARLRGEG